MSHVYRSFALEQARKANYVGFRTVLTKEKMWKCVYEPGDNPADEYAKTADWVHHGEVVWWPNAKDPDQPARVGVLLVNITKDELLVEGKLIYEDKNDPRAAIWISPFDAPDKVFLVEPITPSLWDGQDPNWSPATVTKRNTRQGSNPTGGSFTRARSEVGSPVKLAHEIFNRMQAQLGAVPLKRGDAVTEAVAAGVNKSTAGTQFYHWVKGKSANL